MSQSVTFGRGCIEATGKILSELGAIRPFLVTGKGSYQVCGAKEKIDRVLGSQYFERFEVQTSLPEIHEVERGIDILRKGSFDVVIAIGGGSVLDTAKLIRHFSEQKKTIGEIVKSGQAINGSDIPLLAIPTTAGSGAEATQFAVIYINKKKYSIAHSDILPEYALVDPDLTRSNPPNLAAVSGMDALSQGIESFWSNNSTEESRTYAKQAIRLAYNSLVPAVCNNDQNAQENMCHAAHLAGQAINISKTTASHALSYTLTADYGILHGHAVALTLGEFIKHMQYTTEKDVAHPMGADFVLKTLDTICDLLRASDPVEACINLKSLMQNLGLSTHLSPLGTKVSDIDHILRNINLERLANHPQQLNKEILRNILKEIV